VLALQPSGALRNRYLHGPAVDEILADEQAGGTVVWPLKDQFYNIRDLVDNFGAHYNHYDYDAFGVVFAQWHNGLNVQHAYGFQSRERDQESGLNYHRNRYYDALIARWRSEDPIGFSAGDPNLNRFVANAPTIHTDPTGFDFPVPIPRAGNPQPGYPKVPLPAQEMLDYYRRIMQEMLLVGRALASGGWLKLAELNPKYDMRPCLSCSQHAAEHANELDATMGNRSHAGKQ
jgi:RHS repeat-associated protein